MFRVRSLAESEVSGDELLERVLRAELKDIRARLRRGPGAGDRSRPSGLARDRFARSKTRKLLKRVRRRGTPKLEKEVLVARFRPSAILDALVAEREGGWKPILKRPHIRPVPSLTLTNFSFLDDADATLSAIRRIGELEGAAIDALLHFDDEYCLDAGAYLVLAEIWRQAAPIFKGGRMNRPVQRVLAATGVGRHARMRLKAAELEARFQLDGRLADVWAFPLERRRPALSSSSTTVHLDPQTRERAADRFCEAVDDWLSVPEINQELTDEGKGWIGGIIGELLCNAERHSQAGSNDGDWSTTAFMVRRGTGPEAVYRCYMAFLSVGRSISESMADAAPDIRMLLQDYQRKHWASGVDPDGLATLFALQDTITCDPAARESRTGGTGLQDVLDFVQVLGGPSSPEGGTLMTIVSGRSCVSLRHPYLTGVRRAEGQPRLLWCNPGNTSDEPPDNGIVSRLQNHLAGTLVSVAFNLDPAYLASLVEPEHDSDHQS